MSKVVWTDPALANLDAIRAYVAQFNPSAAGSPAANLMAAGNSLAHFPHRGGPVPKTGMRELVTAFPYIIRYQIFGDEVVILRVRHTARRPSRP